MRIAPAITLSAEHRATLEQRARSRSLPARVVERARIVLLIAEGQQDKEVAQVMKITPKKASRWRKRSEAAPGRDLQNQPRSGVRGKTGRYRWSVSERSRTCAGAVRGREESDPSLESYSTWPTAEARPQPDHDPRLQT